MSGRSKMPRVVIAITKKSKKSVLVSKPALVSAISADEASLRWLCRRLQDAPRLEGPIRVLQAAQQLILSEVNDEGRLQLLADANDSMVKVLGTDRGGALISSLISLVVH